MKRLPIIRHVRWWIHAYRLSRWIEYCQRAGLWYFAQQEDLDYLQDIWDGKQ